MVQYIIERSYNPIKIIYIKILIGSKEDQFPLPHNILGKLPNLGVMPLSLEKITLALIAFTQPSLNATWCNCIIQELIWFERLARLSFVAGRQITAECSHCCLARQGSLEVRDCHMATFDMGTVRYHKPRIWVSPNKVIIRIWAFWWRVHKTGHSYQKFYARQNVSLKIIPPEHRVLGSPFLTSWRRKRLQNVIDKSLQFQSFCRILIYL